jgi:formylglycine-generating enzyme required for sulfatase activity
VADAGALDAGPCPVLSVLVPTADGGVCVDLYEGMLVQTLGDGGSTAWPFNQPVDALAAGSYLAVPAAGEDPQGYISADQAQSACQASGKRLCQRVEWMAACQGPDGWTYPYGNTYEPGACNEGRATNPVIDLFGANASFDFQELNDPRLDLLPNTVAAGGSFTGCVSAYGIYDMQGNVEEWVEDTVPATGNGIFKGGYFVDATINGPGCTYTTTAHATDYHDYSTGFRCCSDPAF